MGLNFCSVQHRGVEHAGPATLLPRFLMGTQDFHPSLSITRGFCDAYAASGAKEGTAQNGKESIERDDYMWEKKKKPTFLLTKGSCWLIALGNTQRLLCKERFSIQCPLLTAAIEEEGGRKKEWK